MSFIDFKWLSKFVGGVHSEIRFMTLAGFPPAIQSAGILLVTTEPAAIILRAPIVTPFRIRQFIPINASSSITTGAETPQSVEGLLRNLNPYCVHQYR